MYDKKKIDISNILLRKAHPPKQACVAWPSLTLTSKLETGSSRQPKHWAAILPSMLWAISSPCDQASATTPYPHLPARTSTPAHRRKIQWHTRRHSRSRDAKGARQQLGRDRIPSRRCQLDTVSCSPETTTQANASPSEEGARLPISCSPPASGPAASHFPPHTTSRSAPGHRDPLLQPLTHRLPRQHPLQPRRRPHGHAIRATHRARSAARGLALQNRHRERRSGIPLVHGRGYGPRVPHGDDGFREPCGSAARGGEDGVAIASAGDGACGAGVDGDSESEARLDEYGAREREVEFGYPRAGGQHR